MLIILRVTRNKRNKIFIVITCGYVSVLYTHLSHLWSGRINYGYNMMLNVAIGKFHIIIVYRKINCIVNKAESFMIPGLMTVAITMLWWYFNRIKLPYAYLISWFNILTILVTVLELADFPPIFWIFDAHSLWHASTVPLTILLYR